MLRAIDSISIEMVFMLRYYGIGLLPVNYRKQMIQKHRLGEEYITQSKTFLASIENDIDTLTVSKHFKQYSDSYTEAIRNEQYTYESQAERFWNISMYFNSTQAVLDSLRGINLNLRYEMSQLLQEELRKVDRNQVVAISILIILFILAPCIIILVRNAVKAIQIFAVLLKKKAVDLQKEKKRADNLINQILPPRIADDLKNGRKTSEAFDAATIMFSEIEGFADITRKCSPLQLFNMLNVIYKTFDDRIDHYNVFKVETISDSYMVVSGIPERNGDQHAKEIANLALDLIYKTSAIIITHSPTRRLKIRIGMHTGAVTAGVIGKDCVTYEDAPESCKHCMLHSEEICTLLSASSSPHNITLVAIELIVYK